MPCFAHQTNLVVADIFKESSYFHEISVKAIEIISFFNFSTYYTGKLHIEQMEIYKKTITLQKPCETRWNSYHLCFSSILNSQIALQVCLILIYVFN